MKTEEASSRKNCIFNMIIRTSIYLSVIVQVCNSYNALVDSVTKLNTNPLWYSPQAMSQPALD